MHLSQNITSTSYFDMREAVSKEAQITQSPETSEKISEKSDDSEEIP